MTTDTIIATAVPTTAVLIWMFRNEFACNGLNGRFQSLETRFQSLEARIQSLENRLDHRIETLDRDLREWARIVMNLQSDVEVLNSKRP